jgi:hypothetical protein
MVRSRHWLVNLTKDYQAMVTSKRDLNEYLFYEFGGGEEEGDEARIADDWPFTLNWIGTIDSDGEITPIYEFSDEDESFFMLGGNVLSFLPQAGMSIDALRLQELGSLWLGQRNPIDLSTVRIGDDRVPATKDRRFAIKQLATPTFAASAAVAILEGIFLCETGEYFALVEEAETGVAKVVGTTIEPRIAGYPEAMKWQRLAVVIGTLLEEGLLPQ